MDNVLDWLQQSPSEEQINYNENGGKFIPYPIIVSKLDILSPHTWETQNFNHFFFHCKDGKIKVSGSVEVIVYYNGLKRTLAGAASFYTEDYAPNEHWGATVKSLAICNAVMILGENFGWNLNPQEDQQLQDTYSGPIPKQKQVSRTIENSIKSKPDADIRKKYAKAVANQDHAEITRLESIYNFTIG